MRRLLLTIFSIVGCAGCAVTPNVTYIYYPTRSATTFTLTQTIDCNADKSALVVVNTPQVTTAYSADYRGEPQTLNIKSLDGAFADSDISVKLSPDGRLQSINQSTTGQGEAVLKSVISLAAAAVGGGKGKPPQPSEASAECKAVNTWGGGKPVTLVYAKTLDLGTYVSADFVSMDDSANDLGLYGLLVKQLPTIGIKIGAPVPTDTGIRYSPSTSDVLIILQRVDNKQVDFDIIPKNGAATIFSSQVSVPSKRTVQVPIPKAALFGKQTFALGLADSGAITSIEYGKNTGAAGPVNVLTSAITTATPNSTAEQAAEVKAQADLIAQQTRLTRCRANPAQCQ